MRKEINDRRLFTHLHLYCSIMQLHRASKTSGLQWTECWDFSALALMIFIFYKKKACQFYFVVVVNMSFASLFFIYLFAFLWCLFLFVLNGDGDAVTCKLFLSQGSSVHQGIYCTLCCCVLNQRHWQHISVKTLHPCACGYKRLYCMQE